MSADTTKAQVAELLDQGMAAKDIAEQLGKTPATVYNHIANIRKDRGDTTPRKRGRPPKNQNDETPKADSKSGTRQRPPVGGKPAAAPATEKVPVAGKSAAAPKADSASNGNGHVSRFPVVHAAIEQELTEARKRVVVLEKMLETV
jgi:transposase-like protein